MTFEMTIKTSRRLALNLLSTLPLVIACLSVTAIAKESAPSDALRWPTSGKIASIDLFRQDGVRSGSVEFTAERPSVYRNWGKASTVTWSVDNHIAGQYLPAISYESNGEVSYTLEVDGRRYEGVLPAAGKMKKVKLPAVVMNRVGINRLSLSISSSLQDNSFTLGALKLSLEPGEVTMSKPVLIAGADWLKIQASLKVNNNQKPPSDLNLRASIKPWPDGEVLWEGAVAATAVAGGFEIDQTIRDLKPKLWSPATPNLYLVTLTVNAGIQQERPLQVQSRIGFREFEAKDGRFYLNGKPVFLRGHAIVPPGGGHVRGLNPDLAFDPDVVRKYLKFFKAQNINIVRAQDPLWQSLCDEEGMMVFVGNYGVPKIPGVTREQPPAFEESAVDYLSLIHI